MKLSFPSQKTRVLFYLISQYLNNYLYLLISNSKLCVTLQNNNFKLLFCLVHCLVNKNLKIFKLKRPCHKYLQSEEFKIQF